MDFTKMTTFQMIEFQQAQENIDTLIYKIAGVLNVSSDIIIKDCQEICATRPVEASNALEKIYIKALGGMTMAEIRQDLMNKAESEAH